MAEAPKDSAAAIHCKNGRKHMQYMTPSTTPIPAAAAAAVTTTAPITAAVAAAATATAGTAGGAAAGAAGAVVLLWLLCLSPSQTRPLLRPILLLPLLLPCHPHAPPSPPPHTYTQTDSSNATVFEPGHGAGDTEMPRQAHLPAMRYLALAKRYRAHSLPYWLSVIPMDDIVHKCSLFRLYKCELLIDHELVQVSKPRG